MTEKELWAAYCRSSHADPDTPYEAWSFGDDADTLADLVYRGIKTATCSLAELYALEPDEPLPVAGELSIILDQSGNARCIIRTTGVYQTRFCDVSAEHACREGEGDRSLSYWRRVHSEFFTKEARAYGLTFQKTSLLICEEFEVLYRAPAEPAEQTPSEPSSK